MLYYCDIFCLIILITLFVLILYNKYYNKNTNTNTNIIEPFLAINDSQLYKNNNSDDTKPVEIKSQIPVPVNQLNDNQLIDLDSNVLRNNRILKNFSLTDELDSYQMINILKQLKNKQYNFKYNVGPEQTMSKISKIVNSEKITNVNSGAINNIDVDLDLFTRIKLELISAFNNLIISSGYYVNYHPYHFFKIINSNLISFENKKSNTTNTIDNYCMTLTFAREYKFQQFIIYYDIDLIKPVDNKNTNTNTNYTTNPNTEYTIILNKVELTGIPVPNTIEFHTNAKIEKEKTTNIDTEIDKLRETQENNNDYYYQDQVSDSATFDVMPVGEKSKSFQKQNIKFIDTTERSDMDLTLLDKNSVTTKIDEKIMNISKDQQFNNHRCYGLVNGSSQELPEYKTPISCKSYHPEINQNGIWDAPCQVDNDCPFYKANKNYPNEYGKCNKITGMCEMPLGIIPIGFTKYGKIEPNCYNCSVNSKDNKCCGKQMDAIKKGNGNVKYLSPDYIFADDENNRKKFKEEIELLGLKVNPSI
jgi:hypothetical protein